MWSPVYFNCALGGSSNHPIRVEFLSLEDGVSGIINYIYELYTHTIYIFVYKGGGDTHLYSVSHICIGLFTHVHKTDKKKTTFSFTEQRTY